MKLVRRLRKRDGGNIGEDVMCRTWNLSTNEIAREDEIEEPSLRIDIISEVEWCTPIYRHGWMAVFTDISAVSRLNRHPAERGD